MGWFKKRDDVVDLGERYRRQQEKLAQLKGDVETLKTSEGINTESSERPPSFFQGLVNVAQQNATQVESTENEYADLGQGFENRKEKLTKRLMEMTSKMEDISNQIYHLTQRIELIERKMNINHSG